MADQVLVRGHWSVVPLLHTGRDSDTFPAMHSPDNWARFVVRLELIWATHHLSQGHSYTQEMVEADVPHPHFVLSGDGRDWLKTCKATNADLDWEEGDWASLKHPSAILHTNNNPFLVPIPSSLCRSHPLARTSGALVSSHHPTTPSARGSPTAPPPCVSVSLPVFVCSYILLSVLACTHHASGCLLPSFRP